MIARQAVPTFGQQHAYSEGNSPTPLEWQRPFAKVTKGMDVIDKLYSGYGISETYGSDEAPEKGPNVVEIFYGRDKYLETFPKLDYILSCDIMSEGVVYEESAFDPVKNN
jgi:hypothetical protein